uniref:Uncharacterized protein n=1 Tax=Plectus sambesii TaxID=2011161 RepID=A0A914VH79_9BILA
MSICGVCSLPPPPPSTARAAATRFRRQIAQHMFQRPVRELAELLEETVRQLADQPAANDSFTEVSERAP